MDIDFQLAIILPELVIAGGVIFLSVAGLFLRPNLRMWVIPLLSIAFMLVAGAVLIIDSTSGYGFHKLIVKRRELDFFKLIILLGGVLTTLISTRYLQRRSINYFEFYVMLLAAMLGAMIAVSTTHFLTLLVGIEILAITSYVMCAIRRYDRSSVEAAFKYFLLGSFSTAFILFGIGFMYGGTGQLHFGVDIFPNGQLNNSENLFLVIGGIMFLGGLAFKLAAAPFHFWAADVYQGAPTAVMAFLISVPKIVFLVIFYNFLDSHIKFAPWGVFVLILANISMLVGNAMAFLQKDIKRLIAFSSVAHSGYLLLIVIFHRSEGMAVLGYYLLAYLLASFGMLAIIIKISADKENILLGELKGLFASSPRSVFLLSFFILSLAGIPLTAGFFGKLFLFYEIAPIGGFWIGGAMIINSIISVGYYILLIGHLFKRGVFEHSVVADSKNLEMAYWLAFLISVGILLWPQVVNTFMGFA
ncbi:MAG: NADH-quinone oxidoreductase subunit N [SAR324 cluster bacterium]|nr:NADH-quinone oxidoreductase subunit N [SAR324 cluster bacterium]